MYCKIADLITKIPAAGDLISRSKEYICDAEQTSVDIEIDTEKIELNRWTTLKEHDAVYIETEVRFYIQLLKYEGMMLHASAVEYDGKAYLFSGYCGVGKSTHTRLWRELFGTSVRIFNDDKPALRFIDGKWYAYGTPWCGKNNININMKVPLAGICFMKQAQHNKIRKLSHQEAVQKIVSQTIYRFNKKENLELMLSHVDRLVNQIPIFELENRPEIEAARLSYETMCRVAEEAGL